MKNIIPLIISLLIIVPALFIGKMRYVLLPTGGGSQEVAVATKIPDEQIPTQGEIEILNGCGVAGLADQFSAHLQKNHYDVKKVSNARSMNYNRTLVISRKPEMEIANQVAALLGVRNAMFIRTEYALYDATVIIGHNYGENNYGQ